MMAQQPDAGLLPELSEPETLTQALASLREEMLKAEHQFSDSFKQLDPGFRDSARNLLHYLALRCHDVRSLQESLANLGLSSLGRAESHVLSALEAVLAVLRQLRGISEGGWPLPEPYFLNRTHGRQLLAAHTNALLGPARAERAVRIMVTMPSEAAEDYGLAYSLIQQGMDCMRINCAHDVPAVWEKMIENLRRAEQDLNRKCKLLMDLGGPKLRTGPLPPGPAVLKLRPRRDAWGRAIAPARIWLNAQEQPSAPPSAADASLCLPREALQALCKGQRLRFADARDAERYLTIVEVSEIGCWAEAWKTCYFTPDIPLLLEERDEELARIGPLPARDGYLLLHESELLTLIRGDEVGAPASLDDRGQVLIPARIGCIPADAFADVCAGEHIWFDDGRIGGVIERVEAQSISVRITQARAAGEKLRSEKGINLPDSRLKLSAITDKDVEDLKFVARHADMVALSFANSAEDVRLLREKLAQLGETPPAVVLKIETRRGFESLPDMLLEAMKSACCGVMIARGDLAVECGFERMAEVQEEILWICESAHVPVIWATQVLEHLAKEGVPSRAEITDAAMADRAECVMLNKGPHIAEAVKTLDDILRRMQAHQSKKSPTLRALRLAQTFPGKRAHARRAGSGVIQSRQEQSRNREADAMSKQVRFSGHHELDTAQAAVVFLAFYHGEMIPCAVTTKALNQHFHGETSQVLELFAHHRDAIERVAAQLILSNQRQADGAVLIQASDCEWLTSIRYVGQAAETFS